MRGPQENHMILHSRPALLPFLLPLLITVPALPGQAAPPPATELAKLKPLEGHWEGSGTVMMDAKTGPSKWNSQSTAQWALGNHFLQQDTYITFEGQQGRVLAFHEYLGWDRENKRYVCLAVSNEGAVSLSEIRFLDDGTLLGMRQHVHEGKPFAERSRYRIDGDTMNFTMDILETAGPSVEMVKGTMKKVPKGRAHAIEATVSMEPAAAAMGRLSKMAGKYEVKGGFVMQPGAKETAITGTDTITGIFAGTVMQVITKGTAEGMPGEYEGRSFMAWDEDQKCYTHATVDNMGMVGDAQSRFAADGKSLITTGTGLEQGQPAVMRYVLELDEKGEPKQGTCHTLIGNAAPFQSFNATYTRK
jgi:hypothetical protein